MNLYISPDIDNVDKGDGGIRRIIEAQRKYLSNYDINIVNEVAQGDVIAVHAGNLVKTDKPIVAHCHGLYWAEYEWPRAYIGINQSVIESLNKADYTTAPSEWVANALRRGMWIDPRVIYHGVDMQDWQQTRDEGYVLWNKTRVDPVCDPSPLDELASRLPNQKFISTFGRQQPNVTLTGRVPYGEAKSYIEGASCYLSTTRETFGIGTIEAMACGIPILGWDWGGQSEFIVTKETGYLVKPGDFDGLIEGLNYCLENRYVLGENARQYVVEHFQWSDIMEKYAELYWKAYDDVDFNSYFVPQYPQVSVVIPCYNMQGLLPLAVQSVRDQSYNNLEIIIVDDASTDNSGTVADGLIMEDPRIKVIHNKTNQYLAEALNTGIEAARGQFILPLDADNLLPPNAIEILVSQMDKVDIAYGAMEVRQENGKSFVSGWPPRQFNFSDQMFHKNQISSTSLYRKKYWSRVGGYRRRCRTAEDADFWCRMSAFGAKPNKVTDATTFIYNNRSESMSHVEKEWGWESWYKWCSNQATAPYTSPIQRSKGLPSFDPPVISVIIPVGPGHTKLVVDALDSLAAQTFTKWEAIVINDSGESLGWIHPFAKIISTVGKKGPSHARNLGIAKSQATLFVPLDADDYLQSTTLECLYNAWMEYRGYIYTDWIAQETGEVYHTPEYDCKEILKMMPHPITGIYPKQAWIDVGGFDESIPYWEDWDFIIAINTKGYCGIRYPEPLVYYRLESGLRRAEHADNRKANLELVFEKWKPYITGEKEPMACGCAKNRTTPRAAVVAAQTEGESTLVEFTLRGQGVRVYRGPSGMDYRFGSDVGHRVKYVLKQDLSFFESRTEFRVLGKVTVNDKLEAVGPPSR